MGRGVEFLAAGRAVLVPPKAVRDACRHGLTFAGVGVPDALVAAQIAEGRPVSPQRAQELLAWFEERQQPDSVALPESGTWGAELPVGGGYIEWHLHGGSAAYEWLKEVLRYYTSTGEMESVMTTSTVEALLETMGAAAQPSKPLGVVLAELANATESARKEFVAIHKKLAPHAAMTAERGTDVMMIREVLGQVAELLGTINSDLKTEFKVGG